MEKVYTVKVEEARPAGDEKPSAGPVYRSIYAKDGLLELPEEFETPWDFFSGSVKRNPNQPMLGRRNVTDSKLAGPYVWLTYQEVYDAVIKMGSSIRSCGINPGDRCGIYGSNCPEWIIAMQACYGHGITYVPLYDTLGPNAVEFIVNHAEVSLAFVQENKIPAQLSALQMFQAHKRKKLKNWVSLAFLGRNSLSWEVQLVSYLQNRAATSAY